ncbi:MAG: response regulator transcription factor [Trueperaceae bacterium]|nr:response regulator transcription factor [Trueperaceae bacterium]
MSDANPATPAETLLIADDHPLFRVGLKYALEAQGFTIVAEASSGQEAVQKAVQHAPNVVLLDVKMPDMDGIEACAKVRDMLPETIVVMLTTFEEEAIVQAARDAGAHGFFSKETDAADLAQAIRRIAEQPERDWMPHVSLPNLTPRELQVLQLLGKGYTNKQMAKDLDLSPETIKDYLNGVYRKLEVRDRLAALNRAHSLGMIQD